MPQPKFSAADGCTLIAITDLGEVELMTEEPAIADYVRLARAEGRTATFLYWSGEEVDTITGRVTWLSEAPQFRFAVLAEEADGPGET